MELLHGPESGIDEAPDVRALPRRETDAACLAGDLTPRIPTLVSQVGIVGIVEPRIRRYDHDGPATSTKHASELVQHGCVVGDVLQEVQGDGAIDAAVREGELCDIGEEERRAWHRAVRMDEPL